MIPAERERFEADLSAWLDGELDAERAAEVEATLERSSSARRALEELRAVSTRVQALPRVAAPADFEMQVLRHAAGEAARRAHDVERRIRSARRIEFLRGGLVATAALFGLYAFRYFSAASVAPDLPGMERNAAIPDPTAPTTPVDDVLKSVPSPAREIAKRERSDPQPPPPVVAAAPTDALDATTRDADDAPPTAAGRGFLARADVPADASEEKAGVEGVYLGALLNRTAESLAQSKSASFGYAGKLAEPSPAPDAPDVSIVLTPRDVADYENAVNVSNDVLQLAAPAAAADNGVGELAQRPIRRQELYFSVPPPQLGQVFHLLENQPPEQVEVQLHFRGGQLRSIQSWMLDAEPLQNPEAPAMLAERATELLEDAAVDKSAELERRSRTASGGGAESPAPAPEAGLPAVSPPADEAVERVRGLDAVKKIDPASDAEAVAEGRAAGAPAPPAPGTNTVVGGADAGYARDGAERGDELGTQVNDGVRVVAQSLQSGLLRVADALVDQFRPLEASPAPAARPVRLRVTVLEPAAEAPAPASAPVGGE